jgi:hypothetical protein
MSRIKTKSIFWYYLKHFLFFFGVFTLLEILAGGLIFFFNLDDSQLRDQLYRQWSLIILLAQNLAWVIYLSVLNYRAGDKFTLRAFKGVWVWPVFYGPFFFYDLMGYHLLDMILIKLFFTMFTLPMIFIGNYKRKKDIERFNISHNLSARKR